MTKLLQEIGALQKQYQNLEQTQRMTKKNICDIVIPFRDKYNLTDMEALKIARDELSIIEMENLFKDWSEEE